MSEGSKETLVSAAIVLEEGRCLEAELESSLLFSSSLLRHPPGSTLDSKEITTLPGGVQDAWSVLQESTSIQEYDTNHPTTNNTTTNNNNNNHSSTSSGSAYSAIGLMQQQHEKHQNEKDPSISLGNGCLGKALHSFALYETLQRASSTAQSIVHKRTAQAPLLTHANKIVLDMQHHHDQNHQLQPTPSPLLQIMDERLLELREYHARHNDVGLQQQQQQQQQQPSHNKRQRVGNTMADGYDLASIVTEKAIRPLLDTDTVFATQEVMGKYLDLQPLFESHVIAVPAVHRLMTSRSGSGTGGATITNTTNNATTNNNTTDNTATNNNTTDNTATTTNTNNNNNMSLVDFLTVLCQQGLASLPERDKLNERKKYVRFLNGLGDALILFLHKTSPLLNVSQDICQPAAVEFETIWKQHGGSNGYKYQPEDIAMDTDTDITIDGTIASTTPTADATTHSSSSTSSSIDLSKYATFQELEQAVSASILKTELSKLGLKCGGTVQDRAKRLFLTKHTPLDQLPKKHFAKASSSSIQSSPKPVQSQAVSLPLSLPLSSPLSLSQPAGSGKTERRVDIARREATVTALLDQLRPTLEATLRRAQRRQTQTKKERIKEVQEELYGIPNDNNNNNNDERRSDNEDSDSDDSDDEPIYNPKGVPLGWDGKPIPYWLFKLHGLNHFYSCEICGNESYRGRRNFEKHFTEQKHTYGLRCLDIPNTKHFHGVTTIHDAQQLWIKLQRKMTHEHFDTSKDEEYEDSHGNVLSRATYEDLARQGLL